VVLSLWSQEPLRLPPLPPPVRQRRKLEGLQAEVVVEEGEDPLEGVGEVLMLLPPLPLMVQQLLLREAEERDKDVDQPLAEEELEEDHLVAGQEGDLEPPKLLLPLRPLPKPKLLIGLTVDKVGVEEEGS
jgi:hypothetical protein